MTCTSHKPVFDWIRGLNACHEHMFTSEKFLHSHHNISCTLLSDIKCGPIKLHESWLLCKRKFFKIVKWLTPFGTLYPLIMMSSSRILAVAIVIGKSLEIWLREKKMYKIVNFHDQLRKIKKKKKKKEKKRKVKNWKCIEEKLETEERTLFFSFFLSFFLFFFSALHFSKPLNFVLGLPKWEFHTGKKFQKNDFAPLKSFPLMPLLSSVDRNSIIGVKSEPGMHCSGWHWRN